MVTVTTMTMTGLVCDYHLVGCVLGGGDQYTICCSGILLSSLGKIIVSFMSSGKHYYGTTCVCSPCMWMGIVMLLQGLQLQHCHQNASLHVLDQIMMLTSVLLLLLHLPLCHLYHCFLPAMDWT